MILRGSFTQDHPIKGMQTPMHSEGHFVVAPGFGIIWAIEKPMAMDIVVTKNGAIQTIGGVPILNFPASKNPFLGKAAPLLCAALGGNLAPLEPDFAIARAGKPEAWRIIFTPRQAQGAPFQSLVAEGGRFVTAATAARADGLSDVFRFADQAVVKELPTPAETALFKAVPMH